MKLSAHSLLLAGLLHSASYVAALRLNVHGQERRSTDSPSYGRFSRRDHMEGLENSNNNVDYYTNITLSGQSYSCLIDTGSSDLWVAGTVPNSKDTGKTTTVNYAIGAVQGPIKTADLGFLDYTVNDQAFIQVSPSSSHAQGMGLIGLGPNTGSHVRDAMGSQTGGDAVAFRIFEQDKSTPNYISILLGREHDPDDPFPGQITIGETVPGYDNVMNQPKVNVTLLSSKDEGNQHWQVLLDEDGIIGPDGNSIQATTHVSSSKNKKQLTAIFDSGYTLPQVPKNVSDGIYARIEGAQFRNLSLTGPVWTMPCDREVNVTFKIGGQSYPIHALDTNMDMSQKDANGTKFCVGSFQTISSSATADDYDIILGMAFLRNAYLVINYGNFVDGGNSRSNPYVQLLSTTNDTAEAHEDFVQVRLDGVDTTGDQRLASTPASSGPAAPEDDDDDGDDDGGIKGFWEKHKKVIIIAASCAGGALVLALLACAVCCGRRNRNKGARVGFVPAAGFGAPSAYRQLHEPAPAGEMHQVQGYEAGARPQYPNPWEHHR